GALLLLYMTWWIGRSEDFEPLMAVFLASVLGSLPFWLRLARGRDKARLFVIGSIWWGFTSIFLAFATPEWPRWLLFAWVPVIGLGYAVVDVMPWSMLGEVIDEDDAETGERREGLYTGVVTFLRRLGGSFGVFLVLARSTRSASCPAPSGRPRPPSRRSAGSRRWRRRSSSRSASGSC